MKSSVLLLAAFFGVVVGQTGKGFGCFGDGKCRKCRKGDDCGKKNGKPYFCNTLPECPVKYTYGNRNKCNQNCPVPLFGCKNNRCINCNSGNCNGVPMNSFYSNNRQCNEECRKPGPTPTPQERCASFGPNIVFSKCVKCEPSCDVNFQFNCGPRAKCKEECRCMKGLVRHLDGCIPPSECPKCPLDSVYKLCPSTCESTSNCDQPDGGVTCNPALRKCNPENAGLPTDGECVCTNGLLKTETGECMMETMCPFPIYHYCAQPGAEKKCRRCGQRLCPVNVMWYPTGEQCELECNSDTFVPPIVAFDPKPNLPI